jgi:ribA/ribD-fused uncharacterized protein
MSTSILFFFGKESPLSNFHECDIEFEGATLRSSEQLFMLLKARTFKDKEYEELIIAAKTPLEAKRLGRKVRNFDEEVWAAVREECMLRACRAKFSTQKETLTDTGTAVLAEANPRDKIWGIGLGASHADARDPTKWRGENLLGKVLMRLRDEFLSEAPKRARVEGERSDE